MPTPPVFTSHNVLLDDGSRTLPDSALEMEEHPWIDSTRNLLSLVYPAPDVRSGVSLVDLGCLEGGHAVEFARMGFRVTGIDVRESNLAACHHIKERVDLPRLDFVKDDAWNVGNHGPFDVVYCCGLLYHIDRPREFIRVLSDAASRVLVLNTHFSTERENSNYGLSELAEHEGLEGRWYREFADESAFEERENARWASWDNWDSFWVRRESLLQCLRDNGFDTVLEQVDSAWFDFTSESPPEEEEDGIAKSMIEGCYRHRERGIFVGIRNR